MLPTHLLTNTNIFIPMTPMAMKRIIYDIANPQVTAFFIYSTSPISLSNLSILSSYSPLSAETPGMPALSGATLATSLFRRARNLFPI